MKRIAVFITQQQFKALQKLADKTGLPWAEHIRRALDAYLEAQKRKEGK